jgi:purine-nucleoside phosphorylase
MLRPKTDLELARHIIDYNPDDPKTHAVWTLPQSMMARRSDLKPVPWPASLAPKPQPLKGKFGADDPLPKTDVLVVTWTVAEGQALSDVLTPGYRSDQDWYTYSHLYSDYVSLIRKGAPASDEKYLAKFFPVKIGGKNVICAKSNLHLSQDGPKMPIQKLWNQMIAETGATLVITTGTAGAVDAAARLGDVVVGRTVVFDCNKTFKNASFNGQRYNAPNAVPSKNFSVARSKLLPVNASQLPGPARTAAIFYQPPKSPSIDGVVTTDFFAFGNTTNTYGLQGKGATVEMGDAVLGLVAKTLGNKAPAWLAIRNASDPEINGKLTPKEQNQQAAQIYEHYGYWTTVNSAIVCWAVIAA